MKLGEGNTVIGLRLCVMSKWAGLGARRSVVTHTRGMCFY